MLYQKTGTSTNLIITVVIFRTIKNYFQIIIIIQIVLIVTGFLKPQPLRLSSPTFVLST